MVFQTFRLSAGIALLTLTSLWSLEGTRGTPLGGMGTGYMVFDARTGDFATSGKIMPPASDAVSEFSNKQSSSSGFHFFVAGQPPVKKAKTNNEDAKCPVYYADFGAVGTVSFKLTAFGPFIPGSDAHAQLAHSPLAFFEITAANSGTAPVEAAVALEFANQNSEGSSLLGGAVSGTATADNKALAYGIGATENAYLLTGCPNSAATFSAGAMGTFAANGLLTNGAGNIAAVKCTIAAGGTERFKFTFAWWRQFRNAQRGNEDYYYHNFFENSRIAAEYGMQHFDEVKIGATSTVERVLATNFPDWYKDRLLNNLYPLIHNSQCAKDGRVGFWEGKYPIIGTIDQGQHAALWYTFNWPSNQWRELQFWARSSHTGVGESPDLKGQVHHDFNAIAQSSWSEEGHFMCAWDDYQHQDYWYQPSTTDWSDLNSMFIFKAYELMLATGDRDSLNKYWSPIKNTADRLIVQCSGSHLPTNSKSTYDNGGIMATYASGTALTAWLCVTEMAKFLGDAASAKKYFDWYAAARSEFAPKYFNSTFGTGKRESEADVAGYSWARYFGFPAIMDSEVVTTACNRLWLFYNGQSDTRAKLGLWHFYTYDHWGGAAIAIGQQDTAMAIHKWDYDYYYTASPAYVFWQDLQSTNNSYASYMTACNVWRSYFQMTGTLVDNANNRLWIRPMAPSSMGKKLLKSPIVNAKGWGTLDYDENAVEKVIQTMTVTFDSLVSIKEIVLKNNASIATPGVTITKNGAPVSLVNVATEGTGYEKNIRVTLPADFKIGPKEQGVVIKVYNSVLPVRQGLNAGLRMDDVFSLASARIKAGSPIRFTVDRAGPVSLELIGINGDGSGTLVNKTVSAGAHCFIWNGVGTHGKKSASGMAILRLRSSAGAVSRMVFVDK